MTARVLIVSPDAGFGGLIQQTLEKVGSYEPVLVSTGRAALELAEKVSIDLAILDADTQDLSFIDLGLTLQANDPGTQILLIPDDETVDRIQVKGLTISGYLTKPFYLPDLVEIVDSALSEDKDTETEVASAAQETTRFTGTSSEPTDQAETGRIGLSTLSLPQKPWLGDVDKAAQHLARLSLSTSAQAALILNRGQLWAYAGQLPKAAAEELAQIVQHDWKRDAVESGYSQEGGVDLARFIHLNVTGGEYLLYVTVFEREMLLALAFDTRTPFSKIHTQASNLVSALISPPEEAPSVGFELDLGAEGEEQEVIETEERQPAMDDREWYWEFDVESDQVPVEGINLDTRTAPADTIKADLSAHPADSPAQSTPPVSETAQSIGQEVEPDPDATKPVRISKPQVGNLRSTSPMVYDIHYACVLLPRLPQHHLTGDLSVNLSDWMRRLSIAFGWRLEYLAVRPGWLQWIACVAPETSPIHVVQLIRQRTSQLIFTEHPRYSVENPSDDFWAPGYLVVTSTKPLPGELVQQFIEQTRLRQGIQIKN